MSDSTQRKTKQKDANADGVFNTRGGPHDLGDPDDLSIRKVEKEVLIPKKLRQKTKAEKCVEEAEAFGKCCRETGVLMFLKCRQENTVLKACTQRWYNDEEFRKECENVYLKERSEYRRTGIKQQMKRM